MRRNSNDDPLYRELRLALYENGFSFGEWAGYSYALPEVPRPGVFHTGMFRGVDLGQHSANFPQSLEVPPLDAYQWLLGVLREQRGGKGRPLTDCWSGFASRQRTNVQTIMTPMRSGHYGLSRGALAFGHHVAEFVFLLHKAYPSAILDTSNGNITVEIDGMLLGLVDGGVIDPMGDLIDVFDEVRLEEFMAPRASRTLMMPAGLTSWRAIHAFARDKGLVDDPDFMQALCHVRWALSPRIDWRWERLSGTQEVLLRDITSRKVAKLDEACEILRNEPDFPMRLIRQKLVPGALSAEDYSQLVAPLARKRQRFRPQVIEVLQGLREELVGLA